MILLAVSGGIDSMCMAEMAYEHKRSFAVAHCNFSLRGDESDIDEKFVRRWCLERGIWYFCKKFDTSAYAAEHGISIEMAARELRYEWFAELCHDQNFEAVAVAHNANDNAETLILNILRGSGGRGLRGMSDSRTLDSGLEVIRPLLKMSRQEIREWMLAHQCGWREDRTNTDTKYKRNLVRQDIFPLFEKINPSFLATIGREMSFFTQENDIASDYYEEHCDEVCDREGIIISKLLGLKHWKYILFRILEKYGINSDIITDLSESLESGKGKDISGKRFGALVCSSDHILYESSDKDGLEMEINGPGTYDFGSDRIEVEVMERSKIKSLICPEGELIADASAFTFPFTLRRWQDGDWLVPFGMRGKKKLSDLFVDLKMSVPQKNRAVVAAKDGEQRILALLGLRIDDTAKVKTTTRQVIVIKISKQI